MERLPGAVCFALWMGAPAIALAQQATPVYEFLLPPVATAEAGFGTATAVLDWDGDGDLDIAVGAPGEGRVYLFLSDGHPTQPSFSPAAAPLVAPLLQAGDGFGGSLCAGQLDGDAADELVVAAPGRSLGGVAGSGALYLFGVGSAGALELLPGQPQAQSLGVSLALGDLDGDGLNDVIASAPKALQDGVPAGAVHLFYGPFGGPGATRVLGNPQGPTLWGNYGHEVRVSDLDGDGRQDLVVSAIGNSAHGIQVAGEVYLHRGPLKRPGGGAAQHELRPQRLLDAWPDPGDLPGPRYGMSLSARAGVVSVGANRKDWGGVKDCGVGFLFRGPGFDAPPVRLLRPAPMAFDLLGIDGTLADLIGDPTPDVVLSSLASSQPMALLVWDLQALGPPTLLAAPPGAGDHFANSLCWGQLAPGGHEELVIGDGSFGAPGGPAHSGRVAILLGIL